ncbi:MAG: hypothetical protein ACP5MH_10320, partial [Thermoproteus sp.]
MAQEVVKQAPPQQPQQQAQEEDLATALANYLGVPPGALKMLDDDDLGEILKTLRAIEGVNNLPEKIRDAMAPVITAKVLKDEDEMDRLMKKAMVYATILQSLKKDPMTEKLVEVLLAKNDETLRLLVEMMKAQQTAPQPPPPPQPQLPPPPPSPPPRPADVVDELVQTISKLKELTGALGAQPQQQAQLALTLNDLPKLLDNLKTLGFEIRPSDRALLESVEKQAYQRGVEDGRRQA